MRKSIILLLGLCVLSPVYAQGVGGEASIAYIQQLAKKPKAEISDAVHLFVLQTGKAYVNYSQGLDVLVQQGVLTKKTYEEKAPLRKGLLALMTTRYLKSGDSLLYKIFGTERYAYVSCISERIMEPGGSEWDYISGSELIEIIGKISSVEEERNAK